MVEKEQREQLAALLKASATRCALLRNRVEKGAYFSDEDALKIQAIDDVLYDLCLDIPSDQVPPCP